MESQFLSRPNRQLSQRSFGTCLLRQNSGALYFCGRDDAYRPILVVDIGKFSKGAEEGDSIQNTLVVIMEFMINELLIEGQVENYVLIMNL